MKESKKTDECILAVIVLFKPEIDLLDRLLKSVINQVDKIYIVDNTPASEIAYVQEYIDKARLFEHYISLGDNLGIACAQNVGIKYAGENGYTHVLLLDQDSELPSGMTRNLLKAESELLKNNIKVAAVGPSFFDEKTGKTAPAINAKFMRVQKIAIDGVVPYVKSDHIIASGSLIRLSILKLVGVMDEKLFIDWVDIEWGDRCSNIGYSSFIVSNTVMKHSIGDTYIKFLGRKMNLHTDFRNYFIVRNATYLILKKNIKFERRLLILFKLPCYVLFYSLVSRRKLYSLALLLRAVYDGVRGDMYRGYFK